MQLSPRADLFRLLGDEDRLRLLALCAEEELTVGELASLLGESQPQVTKKSQPLREVGLLSARRDGTRTLLKAQVGDDASDHATRDAVIDAALEEGRKLCNKDGSFARIAGIVAQREELSRRFFDEAAPTEVTAAPDAELLPWLPLLAPLLSRAALAIDIGTGEGTLLPLLSPIYERVIAVDRSPARLARCAAKIATWGLANVRLREGDVEDAALAQDIAHRGGADLVVMARVLHHAARPQDAIAAAIRLLRGGGHLVIADYFPHDDETMREQGDVWLGFEPAKLRGWLEASALVSISTRPLPGPHRPALQLAVGTKPIRDAIDA
ncbi:MAG: methyltransferase domain-containing protein [Deltaproteobacteria bacterium]|nr:methyltransferase domain-containing protein [Deltaproteobacteria bacterium]MDQ3296309.1 methyltransferase domain-containing protein [Myxococcota bacterium]